MNDPVHFDAGSWWFYDAPGTGRFGPYHSEDEARVNLGQYQAWLQTQQPQGQAPAESPAEPQENHEILNATATYVRLRDAKAELAARHKQEMAEIENELKQVDAQLLDHLNKMGVDSVKTSAGLVHFQTELRAGIGDKGAFMDFIRQSGQPELLQSRVSSTVLREFMEANGGNTPPGVTASIERVIRVRKN